MAEETLSSTIVEDFLTCPICLEIFKEPKILPCLHNFCLSCLTKLTVGLSSNILRCPKCRNETVLSEKGAMGLNTNFYIVNLTDVVQTKDCNTSEALCSFCIIKGKNTPALFKCLDCLDALCKTCSERHTLTRMTMNHRIVDFQEVRNGKYDDQLRSSQGIFCPDHREEKFQYFCTTCDKLVCRDCVLLTHKLHDCMTTEDALKSRIGSIKNLMEEVEGCLKNNKADEEGLNKYFKGLVTEESRLHTLANKLADQVLEKVHDQRKEVKVRITQCFMKPKGETLEQIQKRIANNKMFTESLDFCKSIIRNGKAVEILLLEDLLRQRLIDLQNLPREPKTHMPNTKIASVQLNSSFEGNQKVFIFSETTSADKTIPNSTDNQKENISKSTTKAGEKMQNTQDGKTTKTNPEADKNESETTMKSTMDYQLRKKNVGKLNFITTFQTVREKSQNTPKLTSVTWLNASSFAVADTSND